MVTKPVISQEQGNANKARFAVPEHDTPIHGLAQRVSIGNPSMKKTIADYFKTQPVVKAWIFGSFARGEATPASDVDILVALDYTHLDGFGFFGMWGDLERMLGRSVDLVTESGLNPNIRESVERDKQLIYERTD